MFKQLTYLNVLMNYGIDPVHWAFLDNPHFLQSRNHLQSCILTRKLGLVPESEITTLCYKPLACNSWSVMFRCFVSELHYCSVWVLFNFFLRLVETKRFNRASLIFMVISDNYLLVEAVWCPIGKRRHCSERRSPYLNNDVAASLQNGFNFSL